MGLTLEELTERARVVRIDELGKKIKQYRDLIQREIDNMRKEGLADNVILRKLEQAGFKKSIAKDFLTK